MKQNKIGHLKWMFLHTKGSCHIMFLLSFVTCIGISAMLFFTYVTIVDLTDIALGVNEAPISSAITQRFIIILILCISLQAKQGFYALSFFGAFDVFLEASFLAFSAAFISCLLFNPCIPVI